MWFFFLVTGSNGACWVLSTPSLSWAASVMEKPSEGTQVITVYSQTVALRLVRVILTVSRVSHHSDLSWFFFLLLLFFRVCLEVLAPRVVWVLRWDATNSVHSNFHCTKVPSHTIFSRKWENLKWFLFLFLLLFIRVSQDLEVLQERLVLLVLRYKFLFFNRSFPLYVSLLLTLVFLSKGEPGPPGEAGMTGVPGPKVTSFSNKLFNDQT